MDLMKAESTMAASHVGYKPLLIGVTGGTASGKTSLCKYLLNAYLFLLLYLNSRAQE